MTIPARDVPPGQIFVISERIGDDTNGMEVRETYYVRDPDDAACRFPHNIRIGRLATIQGTPGSDPRYTRVLDEPCRDPGEMDGRVGVDLLTMTHVWFAQAVPIVSQIVLAQSQDFQGGQERK